MEKEVKLTLIFEIDGWKLFLQQGNDLFKNAYILSSTTGITRVSAQTDGTESGDFGIVFSESIKIPQSVREKVGEYITERVLNAKYLEL